MMEQQAETPSALWGHGACEVLNAILMELFMTPSERN